jgi:hypothetical protein
VILPDAAFIRLLDMIDCKGLARLAKSGPAANTVGKHDEQSMKQMK